jgi:hypothetical protein
MCSRNFPFVELARIGFICQDIGVDKIIEIAYLASSVKPNEVPMGIQTVRVDEIRVRVLPDGSMRRADAARYLGYSEKTLANMATRGEGPPPLKVRGRVFYRLNDLDAFVRGE